jgi:hypothetical protein
VSFVENAFATDIKRTEIHGAEKRRLLHCHVPHQNPSFAKIGSGQTQGNVSFKNGVLVQFPQGCRA